MNLNKELAKTSYFIVKTSIIKHFNFSSIFTKYFARFKISYKFALLFSKARSSRG